MADYRRCYVSGGSFFFTLVTERRAAIFGNDPTRDLLRAALSGLPATLAVSGRYRKLLALEFGMKRGQLIKRLNAHGAFLLREGSGHSIYQLGHNKTQVPRHTEIVDELARKICKDLGIPFVR